MKVEELRGGIGKTVTVNTSHYFFKDMNGRQYIITGMSRELKLNDSGKIIGINMVQIARTVGDRQRVWLPIKEVELTA